MWTGPLACLSLSSVIVVDKDQDSPVWNWVSTALVPRMQMKTRRVKIYHFTLHDYKTFDRKHRLGCLVKTIAVYDAVSATKLKP